MARAIWRGQVVAESETFEVVEGNVYFPPEAIRTENFQESAHHTVCGWKGTASYYDLVVEGERNPNAAWYYPAASEQAKKIEGYVAFWNGIEVK